MSDDPKYQTHPSYGLIQWGHAQGSQRMFAAIVDSGNHVRLTISNAKSYTDELGFDRYYPESMIIEVAMTESQFATFITSPNTGLGTPCTITRRIVEGKGLVATPPPPDELGIHDKLRRDVDIAASRHNARASRAVEQLKQLVGASVPAKKKREFEILLEQISSTLTSDLKFARERLDEQAADLSQRVKTEVQGAINARLHQLGVESFKAMTASIEHSIPALPALEMEVDTEPQEGE